MTARESARHSTERIALTMGRNTSLPFVVSLTLLALQANAGPARAGEPPELRGVEIARLGRSASALVLAESGGEGSAFCVAADGWFVTNHHVIAPVSGSRLSPQKEGVKLVLNSGRQDQQMVKAKVVWSDQDWDLALLEAEGVKGFRCALDCVRSGPRGASRRGGIRLPPGIDPGCQRTGIPVG